MLCKRTQSDYFRMNNNIFDTETDENGHSAPKLSAIQMRVLAALYSLAPFSSYRVKVRQSVLAEKCGCSVSTIKRAVDILIEKRYIQSAARDELYSGSMKLLGTYTYVLPSIVKKGYFYVNRKALTVLDKLQTRVYLFLCKCSRKTMDCWNSFSDIARQLGLQRNAVVQTIRELIEKQVIDRRHNHKKDGSFNDNTYTIEDIETSRTNDDFIADFFSGDDQCECVIIPLEKKNDCRVASTAADKSRVETPYSHRKAFHTSSLQPFSFAVKSMEKKSFGFFYNAEYVP